MQPKTLEEMYHTQTGAALDAPNNGLSKPFKTSRALAGLSAEIKGGLG